MRLAGGIPRIVLTAAAVVGLLASGLLLAAEDPAPGGPVQFRRIYVPAERIGEIPAAQGRIVPMDAARFAELLERAERPPGETATAVENIQYTARLEGDALLTGRATLQIRHTGDPVLLPLGTCLAAVQHAVWQRGATRVPARLGADAQQRLVVLVQQAGVLEFEFALQGRSDAVGNWRFPLQLPTAPQHELTCQFPASATASVVGGVVTAVDVDDKQQTWTIQWPPSGQADLVLARPPTDESLRANFLRQADQYALGLDGLELTTTVSLDVQREPLQELVLQLDKSLQLVDVRLGAQQIAWSPREGEGAAGRLVSLQFPQPLAGTQRAVVIRALAPLQTRQSWRLPRIRPQGFVWLEGTCTLLVSEPLTLARLNVDRGRQLKITSLPGSHAGESLEFQFHSPQAGIDVVLANKPGRLATDTLTSIEIADQKLNARVVLDASAEDGSFYALHGTVGQGWQITSVVSDADTNPPGIAVQWSQVGSRVSFWLPRGLAPQRPLRLTLRAVKDQPSPARRLRSPLLRVVTLEGTHHARHRLHLWTQRPYRLQAEGEASTPVAEAGSLPAADRQRLGLTNLTGLCWEDQPREGEVVIAVRRESPAYQVENDVVVEVSEQQIRYRYRIRCQPSSRPVDRLVVHFTATDSVAPDWTLAEMAGVKITARRLRGAEQRRWGLGAGGQTWELSWNRSLRDTFQLLGRCEVPGAGQQAVSLMATPTAATQTGRLTVLGTDTARLDLRRDGLQPLPIPAQRWEVFSSVRGYYRYDPLREMTATRPALVMTASDTSPANPRAVVWRRNTTLRIAADAHTTQRTIFEVENHGARQMAVMLPPDVEIQQAAVDDQPVIPLASPDPRKIVVRLPADRRFVTVSIDCSRTPATARFLWLHQIDYQPLDTDLPILSSRRWMSAAAGFAVWDGWDRGPCAQTFSWRDRLFGSWARAAAQPVWDPLRPATWTGRASPPPAGTSPNGQARQEPLPWTDRAADGEVSGQLDASLVPLQQTGADVGGSVYLVDELRLRALSWALGLAVALTVWFWWPAAWSARWAWVALPAVAALLLPGLVAPLATAAFTGALAAMIAKWLGRGLSLLCPRTSSPGAGWGGNDETVTQHAPVPTSQSTFPKAEGYLPPLGLFLVASAILHPLVIHAAETPRPPTNRIYPVYIPMDEQRRPSGGTFYLPQPFFDLLHRQTAGRPGGTPAWIITQATYTGHLRWDERGNRLAMEDLAATFELDVSHRHQEARIRLGNEIWRPSVDLVTWNGQPAAASWDDARQELIVPLRRVGTHQLVVPLGAVDGDEGVDRQLTIPIPAVPTARLVLTTADNAPEIEVPTAWGRVVRDAALGRLTAHLGGAQRLTLKWPLAGPAPEAGTLDVDQLLVLDLQPGAVVVRAKLKLHTQGSGIRQLRLALDPQLSPLPMEPGSAGEDGVSYELVQTVAGDPQQLVMQFPRTISGRQTVELAFFVRDAVGVGNVRLPYLEVQGARTSRHWVVVSTDAALQVDVNAVQPHPALVAVERDALVAEWDLGDVNPVLSYRQAEAKVDWSFPSQPQTPTTQGTRSLSISYGPREVTLGLEADLQTSGGYLFGHQLELPAGLQVEEVEVRGAGQPLVRRWAQAGPQLSVFLTGPVTGPHQLQVRGRMPRVGAIEQPPAIQLQNVRWNESRLAVYRQDTVLVTVDNRGNVEPVGPLAGGTASEEGGRLVGEFRWTGNQATCRLAVQPNDPQLQAIQVIRILRRGDHWLAELDLRLTVQSGCVDSLTFDIPATWQGPFEVDPSEPLEVQPSADANQALLVIRPRQAITRSYRLQIRGRLSQGIGQRVVTPVVRLRTKGKVQRFVLLPKLVGGREAEWETTGLEPAPLPADPAQPPLATTAWESYRIATTVHQAALKTRGQRQPAAKVHLANISLATSPDGRHLGLAQYDLEPAGESTLGLELPGRASQLVQCRIGDSVLPLKPTPPGRWELPLVSRSLPQRVEVLFLAAEHRPAGSEKFQAPRLLGRQGPLPVERTLWTILGSTPTQPDFGPDDPGQPVTAWDVQVERFHRTADMLQDLAADDRPQVLLPWHQRWTMRLDQTYAQLQRLAAKPGEERAAPLRQLDSRRALFRRLAQQASPTTPPASIQQSQFFTDRLLAVVAQPVGQARHWVSDGWRGEVQLTHPRAGSGWGARLLAVAVVLALWRAAFWLTAGGRRWLFEREMVALAVFTAGLVWWLWISPSGVGLVLMAAAAALTWGGEGKGATA